MGWIADALLEQLGFGVVGTSAASLVGTVSGLVVWNCLIIAAGHQSPADHRHRDVLEPSDAC